VKRTLPFPVPVSHVEACPLDNSAEATHRVEAGPIAGCVIDNRTEEIVIAPTPILAVAVGRQEEIERELADLGYEIISRWAEDEDGVVVADLRRAASYSPPPTASELKPSPAS
jgi:hypothetical protein